MCKCNTRDIPELSCPHRAGWTLPDRHAVLSASVESARGGEPSQNAFTRRQPRWRMRRTRSRLDAVALFGPAERERRVPVSAGDVRPGGGGPRADRALCSDRCAVPKKRRSRAMGSGPSTRAREAPRLRKARSGGARVAQSIAHARGSVVRAWPRLAAVRRKQRLAYALQKYAV